MEIIHISFAGPIYRIIDEDGKNWLFEMNNYCGPIPLRKTDHEPMVKIPCQKSPFWQAVTYWAQQGQKVDKDNYCIYEHKYIDHDEL